MADTKNRTTPTVADLNGRSLNRRRLMQGTAALGLAGISGVTLPGLSSGVLAQEVETLNFYHDKTPWDELLKAQGDLAEAAIGVNWETSAYGDTTSYQAALLASLPTSDTPDLFTWWSGYRMEDLANQNVLEDVSDVWTQAIADGNLPESLASAFTFSGMQVAIPSTASYWVVFYNKQVFTDNNVTVPTTWAEFTAACDTFKAAGITPIAASQVGRWPAFIMFEEMVLRTDPDFYVELTAGRAKYTDETCKQAMNTWKSMIDAEYFTSFDTDLFADVPGMLQSGEVAMLPIGTWYQSTFTGLDMVPGTDYDMFILPNINDEVTTKSIIVETGALAIAKNSSKIEAAKKMVNWWVTPDANTAWSNALGDAPFNPKSTSDNAVNSNLLTALADGGYTLYQRYWEASPVPIVEGAVDFLAEFMLNPDSLDDVLQKIQDLADSEWEKRGGPAAAATPTN